LAMWRPLGYYLAIPPGARLVSPLNEAGV